MSNISIKKLLLTTLIVAFSTSCKVSAVDTKVPSKDSFHYARLGWDFKIPNEWEEMTEETFDRVTKAGKKVIPEYEDLNVESIPTSNRILALEQEGSLFIAMESLRPEESMPYHRTRLELFNFLYQNMKKQTSYETEYETKGIQLGNLFFKMITIVAKPKSSYGQTLNLTHLETLYNGKLIMLQLTSVKTQLYQKTLESLLSSTFRIPEFTIPETWEMKSILNGELHIPNGLEKSKSSSDSLLIFKNSKKKESITIRSTSKKEVQTLQISKGMDLARFTAELDFGVQAMIRESKEETKTKEEFISGKRCFTGDFKYQRAGVPMRTHFAYIIGRKADFQIHYDIPTNSVNDLQVFRKMIASLTESEPNE